MLRRLSQNPVRRYWFHRSKGISFTQLKKKRGNTTIQQDAPVIFPINASKFDSIQNMDKNRQRTHTHTHVWLLIKIPLSRNGHSSRIKILLSRNFRELHVYLSRGPCWPTTPLMKIRSPPAKLRQRITDHFLVAF